MLIYETDTNAWASEDLFLQAHYVLLFNCLTHIVHIHPTGLCYGSKVVLFLVGTIAVVKKKNIIN